MYQVDKCFCGNNNLKLIHTYTEKPKGEVDIEIRENYERKIFKCFQCNHFYSVHDYDLSKLYNEDYVSKTYGNKIYDNFSKIISLSNIKSDNFWRVQRVINFINKNEKKLNVVDVGSGLCVFLYELIKHTNWTCYSVDPDKRQSQHAKNLGFKSFNMDFNDFCLNKKFDLITFNKVLEHIEKPELFLKKAKNLLSKSGYVYLEVPDGTEAFKISPLREEFYIDHHHVFSMSSLINLIKISGLKCIKVERIREPSNKFTLTCFAKKDA